MSKVRPETLDLFAVVVLGSAAVVSLGLALMFHVWGRFLFASVIFITPFVWIIRKNSPLWHGGDTI